MSDKFIWTKADTSLLISLWSDNSVQQNLQDTPRNVAIWNGIARYMRKRGIDVKWLQCRQRIKRLMGRYRKVKRGAQLKLKNTADSFFHELDSVLTKSRLKKLETDSSSLDISNEASVAVEALIKEPKYDQRIVDVGLGLHTRPRHSQCQTLELKENEKKEDVQPPTPKIESSRHRTPSPKPSTKPRPKSMAKPSGPVLTSEKCVSDIDLSASPNNVNSVEVVFESQCDSPLDDHEAEYLDSTLPLAYANSTDSDNPTRAGNKEKDPNYLVKQDESDNVTRVLVAQAETTQRLLEANRAQQERLECKMNKIVGQLEQMNSVSNQGFTKKLETKLDLMLHQLNQIIPHANLHASEHALDRKLEVGLDLERLEHIIPYIEQYNLSAPNLVEKIDSLLLGLDRMAPYAYDLIEVSTDVKSGQSE